MMLPMCVPNTKTAATPIAAVNYSYDKVKTEDR